MSLLPRTAPQLQSTAASRKVGCVGFVARVSCASDAKLGGVRLVHFGCFEQAQEQLDEASSQKQQNLKPFSACTFLVRSVRLGFTFSSSTSRRSRCSRRCFAALILESLNPLFPGGPREFDARSLPGLLAAAAEATLSPMAAR